VHRDLAGFDFTASPVDRKLIQQLAELAELRQLGPRFPWFERILPDRLATSF
jgi:hypothetical protein